MSAREPVDRDPRGNDGTGPQPRLIRSDRVHYPGMSDVDGQAEYERRRDSGDRLRPLRDTGIQVRPRSMRNRLRREKARRQRRIAIAIVVALAILALVIWRVTAEKPAPASPQHGAAPAAGVEVAEAVDETVAIEPTPLFASYGSVRLRVPVPIGLLTELGWHQASYSYAMHLKSLLPTANMTAARKNHGTRRDLSKQKTGDDAILTGFALAMWRNSNDRPDSAVDVGAAPGTPVLAPLAGTVVLVKPYELYGKFPDVRIHIQPEGRPDLDLVLIHVQNPKVKAGDKVVAGVTQVGEVRKLSDKVTLQLRSYVRDEGNHVHIQLNNAKDPSYKGLQGAIKVPASTDERSADAR